MHFVLLQGIRSLLGGELRSAIMLDRLPSPLLSIDCLPFARSLCCLLAV